MDARLVAVIFGGVLGLLLSGLVIMLIDDQIDANELEVHEFEWVGSKGTLECVFVMKGGIGAVYCPEMFMSDCRGEE